MPFCTRAGDEKSQQTYKKSTELQQNVHVCKQVINLPLPLHKQQPSYKPAVGNGKGWTKERKSYIRYAIIHPQGQEMNKDS